MLKPRDTVLLWAIQRKLIRQIIRTERHIGRWKSTRQDLSRRLKTERPSKSDAQKLRAKISWIDSRLEALAHLLFIWRCFGDGIAFAHLDKFALKQTFFETDTVRIKQKPGWLSGKSGFSNEISIVKEALGAGLPCMLTDLTNTIRHGDVCVLVGPDPILLEAKSSEKLNSRGKRQIAALSKLHEFYKTDQSDNLRGMSDVRRVAIEEPEVNYIDELNRCIEQAATSGVASVNPERGVHYMAVYDAPISDAIGALSAFRTPGTEPVFLNELKSASAWAPFYPFVLSIRQTQHLFDFVRGHLVVMMFFDSTEFEAYLAERGIFRVEGELPALGDPDDYLLFEERATGTRAGMSKQVILRFATEFMSPAWMFRHYERLLGRAGSFEGKGAPRN